MARATVMAEVMAGATEAVAAVVVAAEIRSNYDALGVAEAIPSLLWTT